MRCQRGDRGAAAVETALVLPFLLLLLCGFVDLGRAYNAKVTLTHAAREGVRAWALTQDQDAATSRTREAAVGLDPVAVAVTSCDFSRPTTLRATYSFSYITPLAGLMALLPGGGALTNPVELNAKGVMRCGG